MTLPDSVWTLRRSALILLMYSWVVVDADEPESHIDLARAVNAVVNDGLLSERAAWQGAADLEAAGLASRVLGWRVIERWHIAPGIAPASRVDLVDEDDAGDLDAGALEQQQARVELRALRLFGDAVAARGDGSPMVRIDVVAAVWRAPRALLIDAYLQLQGRGLIRCRPDQRGRWPDGQGGSCASIIIQDPARSMVVQTALDKLVKQAGE